MLVDDVRGALPSLRAEAEAAMVDECTIRRGATQGEIDNETGDYTAGTATVVYSGRCLVSGAGAASDDDRSVGSLSEAVGQRVLKLPHNSPAVQVGDAVTIDTSENAELVDQVLIVREAPDRSIQVQRRLLVEDSAIAESQ